MFGEINSLLSNPLLGIGGLLLLALGAYLIKDYIHAFLVRRRQERARERARREFWGYD